MRFQPITINSTSGAIWDAYIEFMVMEMLKQKVHQGQGFSILVNWPQIRGSLHRIQPS